ncbi:flagellar basal body rod protein FlgB [Pseudothauera nasutitermitis]|uniref:Flagellar basal body rod protein FlgB n=1 Tax=Pseudothauera nasutitermitis TaxID=2565930 RepID=A0A4S4AZU6_9RHOO|nr:flagellar basal body rod protein FlgB [Pseudothauera nasutitermitis]THF65729.1 flagellar basal body rod protein FlgB [Pseudothauera nasutitermitis]
MKNLLDNNLQNHMRALNVQAYRQQLLASNIANADTPHYKARDVDFRGLLQGALDKQRQPLALATTSARHIEPVVADSLEAHTLYRQEYQSAVDGNTVEMDVERAAFAENSIHYEASVTFINGLLRGMQTAISGQ